jgi:CHAD domain-containing protein
MKLSNYTGFRIYKGEILPVTWKRVMLEQLNMMLVMSEKFKNNPDYATHEIRKTTKRIRAVYRLYRRALGEETYIHGKEIFSSLSSLLATQRVSAVHLEILKEIARDAKNPVDEKLMREMISAQQQEHLKLTKRLIDKQQIVLQIKHTITSESEKLAGEQVFSCSYLDIIEGLRGTYISGKKCLDLLTRQSGTENFHELRKKVKLLWNQLILIRPVWPAMFTPMIRQMDLLAEKLGTEHDLAELENLFISVQTGNYPEASMLKLNAFIASKRESCQKKVLNSALRLYAEKPAAFIGRMASYCRLFWGA